MIRVLLAAAVAVALAGCDYFHAPRIDGAVKAKLGEMARSQAQLMTERKAELEQVDAHVRELVVNEVEQAQAHARADIMARVAEAERNVSAQLEAGIVAKLAQGSAEASAAVDGLKAELAAARGALARDLIERIAALDARLKQAEAAAADWRARIQAIEARPVCVAPSAPPPASAGSVHHPRRAHPVRKRAPAACSAGGWPMGGK